MVKIKLNNAQARHVADSLRAFGIGQIVAFGYTGIKTGHWLIAAVSLGFLLIFEISALFFLRDVEDT